MNTVTAVDALFLIDLANAGFVVENCANGADFFTGPFLVNDGTVGAGLCAKAAGLAFGGINAHLGIAGGYGAESTGVQAGFSQTETADVRDKVILDRTVITSGRNDRYNIVRRMGGIRILPHGQADPSPDNFPLFVDAATVLGLGTGTDIIDDSLCAFT